MGNGPAHVQLAITERRKQRKKTNRVDFVEAQHDELHASVHNQNEQHAINKEDPTHPASREISQVLSIESREQQPNGSLDLSRKVSTTDFSDQKPEGPTFTITTPATAGLSETSPVTPIIRKTRYTTYLRTQPPKTFMQNLKPWNGRMNHGNWFLIALRPFILYAYPSILWSALVYSLSIGWLIVLSESVSTIYRNKESYNFSPLGVGLVYVSPFVGGVLGTAVAGKVSDIIVRFMSRRNGGVYEPEFRLVMAIPIAISTIIGLMGFGWSAQEKDLWIVPTIFFGVISFGCSLGSTTSITFAVDSYRQYAGEALVTLNFSKSESISGMWLSQT